MTEPPVAPARGVVARLAERTTPDVPFSVEFYPPRDEAAAQRLWRAARAFESLGAAFVSVTYGAGGSTRENTVEVVREIVAETTLNPVAHLTAVGHSVAELRDIIAEYARAGVHSVLALRGDPPGDPLAEWVAHPEGLRYASELVELVKGAGDFEVGVASFPEGHHRARDLDHDTEVLVAKLRAGADFSITQMFWDVDDYLRLRDRVAAFDPEQGAKPVIPGLFPITSLRQVSRIVELSGSELPRDLRERLEAAAGPGDGEDRAAVRAVGIDVATRMCERLVAEGAPCLHFNTLNFSRATQEVLANLGLVPPPGAAGTPALA